MMSRGRMPAAISRYKRVDRGARLRADIGVDVAAGVVVGRMRGAARQHHADRLGDRAHRVGREHRAAGAAAGHHVAFELEQFLGRDPAGLVGRPALGIVHDREVRALGSPRRRNPPVPASWCPDRAPARTHWSARAASGRRRRSCRSRRSRSSRRRDGRNGRSRSNRRRRRATPGCSLPWESPASSASDTAGAPTIRPCPPRSARISTSRSAMLRTRLLQRWALV